MNKYQQHYLEKIRLTGQINEFNGELIAEVLIANQHLYTSFIFLKEYYLIELRDLPHSINADVIWFLAPENNYRRLKTLFKELNANEFGSINKDGVRRGCISTYEEIASLIGSHPIVNDGEMLMRVWWD